jgi:hypothetical protein
MMSVDETLMCSFQVMHCLNSALHFCYVEPDGGLCF